ncbi:MAG: aggregation factor core protein MAFp3, isoform C [Pseudomonadota bacterium]
MRLITLCLATTLALPATADVTVQFRDGAPKDRFTLTYTGTCALGPTQLVIDLGTAPAGLIFDITAAGAGVDVFQPLEWVEGSAQTSNVTDGDTALTVSMDTWSPGETRAFTVDIDDTTSGRQITVDGSEMVGATLRADGLTALFDATGSATLPLDPCTS